jgi:hypothetical protein
MGCLTFPIGLDYEQIAHYLKLDFSWIFHLDGEPNGESLTTYGWSSFATYLSTFTKVSISE